MANNRVCHSPRRLPRKRACENLPAFENSPASVACRGRSRSQKRSIFDSRVGSQIGEVITRDSDGFVNLEVDLSLEVETYRNRKSIRNPDALDEGSFANNCKITSFVCKDGKSAMQCSMPCSVIGSKKIPDVCCEDEGETCSRCSPEKGPGNKSMQLQCRNAVAKLDNYLDTDIIDRYMEDIWKKLPKYKQKSCIYLDCLWFSMYLEEALSLNILKWTKAKRIFSKGYVFIPIVHWGHWNLLILCHFGEKLSSEARTPCMLLLDSLKETEPSRLEPLIRKFLLDVYKEDGKRDGDKIISKIPLLVPEVPQQTNGNDCGVFLLHFVELFLNHAPKNFSISEGCYPYFLTKNWFKSHEIGKRRKHIYDVVLNDQHCVSQMTKRRISTRSKKLHGFLNSDHVSKWIDLSTAP